MRFAKNNYLVSWPNEITCGLHFHLINTKLLNEIPTDVANLPFYLFKKTTKNYHAGY